MADQNKTVEIKTSQNVCFSSKITDPEASAEKTKPTVALPALGESNTNEDSFKMPEKITFQLPKLKKSDVAKDFSEVEHTQLESKPQIQKPEVNKMETSEETGSFGKESKALENKSKEPTKAPDDKTPHVSSKYDFPAQKLSQATIPYKEPTWGGPCEEKYKFEVLKNGTIMDSIDLTTKSFHVLGRLPSCDVTLEHPSLSRHHAVVQFCKQASDKHECGWYLYDLDSTHGTWLNKTKIKPKVYIRLRVGHMIKFGGSSRLFILQGPRSDTEEESELTVTEIKEQRERQKREVEVLRIAEQEERERKVAEQEKRRDLSGCSWGIEEEEAEEEPVENPFAVLENEELYINDPKKSLQGYFEREGYDQPEYEIEEAGFGKYKCQVELPVDTPTGQPMIAEVVVSGKKKEAVLECALEACRMLDRHGLLRNATHESRKRKQKNWEDADYYDSDEDTFLDRTGDIEKKRSMRMKKAGKLDNKAHTYDSLMGQHKEVVSELEEIEAKLDKARRDAEMAEASDVDALDAYMMSIKSGAMDTKTKMKLKCRQLELKKEELRLRKLINIAKPASLPELNKQLSSAKKPTEHRGLPTVGKKRIVEHKVKKVIPLASQNPTEMNADFVEEEDEDEDMDTTESAAPTTTTTPSDRLSSSIPGTETTAVGNDRLSVSQSTNTGTPSPADRLSGGASSVADGEKRSSDTTSTVVSNVSKNEEIKNPLSTDDNSSEHRNSSKHKVPKLPKMPPKVVPPEASGDYDATDPDFAVWVPPTGQTGDGRTHLNDKFGY